MAQPLEELIAEGLAALVSPGKVAPPVALAGGLKHVKTPAGAKFYHLPIGSLIIAHDKETTAEAGWVAKGEAIWKANEWHGEGSRVIYGPGMKPYQIPAEAKVYVPNGTDLSNPEMVAKAPKMVRLMAADGTSANLNASIDALGNVKAGLGAISDLAKKWTPVPADKDLKPVVLHGQIVTWIPWDWKVYAGGQGVDDPKVSGYWGLKPGGGEFFIDSGGIAKPTPSHSFSVAEWASGTYTPSAVTPSNAHEVIPPGLGSSPGQLATQAATPKPSFIIVPLADGGVLKAVSSDLASALYLLQQSHSTQVKQPLKDNPLGDMDYHKIAQEWLKDHPEHEVPGGTKAKHVGQVKTAVMAWLADQIQTHGSSDAEYQQAEAAMEQVNAAAGHAQQLDPGIVEIDGKLFSAADLALIVGKLKSTQSTQIKQTLAAMGSQMADVDYWKVVHDAESMMTVGQKANPEEFGIGKGAKGKFIWYLEQRLAEVAAQDQASGHQPAADIHDALFEEIEKHKGEEQTEVDKLLGGDVKFIGKDAGTAHWAIAGGMLSASVLGGKSYIYKLASGDWHWASKPPPGPADVHYVATPEHTLSAWTGSKYVVVSPHTVKGILDEQFLPATAGAKDDPEFQKLVVAAYKDTGVGGPLSDKIGWGLYFVLYSPGAAQKADGKGGWAVPAAGGWKTTSAPGAVGPGEVQYHIVKDSSDPNGFRVEAKAYGGGVSTLTLDEIKGLLQGGPPIGQAPEPAPQPVETEGDLQKLIDSKPAGVAGSPLDVKFAQIINEVKPGKKKNSYIEFHAPDNGWWTTTPGLHHGLMYHAQENPIAPGGFTMSQLSPEGVETPLTIDQVIKVLKEGDVLGDLTAPEPPQDDLVHVVVQGKEVGTVPAGSVIYREKPDSHSAYVKLPDGNWQQFFVSGGNTTVKDPFPPGDGNYKALEEWVQSGTIKPDWPPQGSGFPGGAIPVQVGGKQVATAPAGSKVYAFTPQIKTKTQDWAWANAGKYVQAPDGLWTYYDESGKVSHGTNPSAQSPTGKLAGTYEALLADGKLTELDQPDAWHPVQIGDVLAGQVPPDATVFKKSDGTQALKRYVRFGDGHWESWTKMGKTSSWSASSSTAQILKDWANSGLLEKVEGGPAPTAIEAKLAAIIKGKTPVSGAGHDDFEEALADTLAWANDSQSQKYLVKNASGSPYWQQGNKPDEGTFATHGDEFWIAKPNMTVEHVLYDGTHQTFEPEAVLSTLENVYGPVEPGGMIDKAQQIYNMGGGQKLRYKLAKSISMVAKSVAGATIYYVRPQAEGWLSTAGAGSGNSVLFRVAKVHSKIVVSRGHQEPGEGEFIEDGKLSDADILNIFDDTDPTQHPLGLAQALHPAPLNVKAGAEVGTFANRLGWALQYATSKKKPVWVSRVGDTKHWQTTLKGRPADAKLWYTVSDIGSVLQSRPSVKHPEKLVSQDIADSTVNQLLTGTMDESQVQPPEGVETYKIAGVTYNIPEIAQLYSMSPSPGAKASVYARLNEQDWRIIGAGDSSPVWQSATRAALEAGVNNGTLKPYDPEKPAPPLPEGEPITVLGGLKVIGEAPAGSHLYNRPDYPSYIYVHLPDGSWQRGTMTGTPLATQSGWDVDTLYLQGKLKEYPAPTKQELGEISAKIAWLNKLNTSTAALPPEGSTTYSTWQPALAAALTEGTKQYKFALAVKMPSGQWNALATNYPDPAGEAYTVRMSDLTTTHVGVPIGHPAPVPVSFATIHKEIDPLLVEHTVNVLGLDGKYTTYQHGYYSSPKGKAALEIKAPGPAQGTLGSGPPSKAAYIYHLTDGTTTQKTPIQAAKYLETMTQYDGPEPKWQFPVPERYFSWASRATPGAWFFTPIDKHEMTPLEMAQDGSAIVGGKPQSTEWVKQALIHGQVLDKYGSSLATAGYPQDTWYMFGSAHKNSLPDLKKALKDIEESTDKSVEQEVITRLAPELKGVDAPGYADAAKRYGTYMDNRGASTFSDQRDAIMGLLRDWIDAPNMKAAAPVTATYDKAAPGVSAKGLFSFNAAGHAAPTSLLLPVNMNTLSKGGLVAFIKGISSEYGGGKVVGQHPAGLDQSDALMWLKSWQAGDMATVFKLDMKSGGKLSPAHPGSPKNPDTHKIVWAPFGKGEVPANEKVPGEWTDIDNGIVIPKDEIGNYIIKAGLAHPEWLTDAERRSWVTWHRKQDQQNVDYLSRLAQQRFDSKQNKITDTPVWKEGIKPAKSYDAFLEENKSTEYWNDQAIKDFYKDHNAELADEKEQIYLEDGGEESTGYSTANAYMQNVYTYSSAFKRVVQAHLDRIAAAELAFKNQPRFTVVPGEPPPGLKETQQLVTDQFGHQYIFRQVPQEQADVEVATSNLAKLWGFKTPVTREVSLQGPGNEDWTGPKGIAQNFLPGVSTLAGIDVSSLTPRQQQDIAAEHVLDWALDNPDGDPSNFVQSQNNVIGIDKDQSWTGAGNWDGLGLKSDAKALRLSTQLYNAIKKHQISQPVADASYIEAMRTAHRMEQLPDQRMRDILEQAFAHSEYLDGPAKTKMIDGIVARKNSLEHDFGKLWAGIYKTAKWTPPEVPQERLPAGLHSGFSEPTYFDHVMAARSFGVPAFFAGDELEDGNVLAWTELSGTNRLIRGEGVVRGNALGKLTTWAKSHVTGFAGNIEKPKPAPAEIKPGQFKLKGAWMSKLINGAKAVSIHAEQPDYDFSKVKPGGYTETGLNALNDLETGDIPPVQDQAEKAIAKGPDSKEWAAFVKTYGSDPEVTLDGVKYYQALIAKVNEAKANHGGFKPGDLPDWKQPPAKVYPKKVVEEKKPEPPPPPKPVEPPVKVEWKPAVRDLAIEHADGPVATTMNPEDGELHLNPDKSPFSYPGKVFYITLPTGEVIELSDSDDTHTPPGQVGRLRFRAVASDGAASLERIRAQLQSMGMTLQEAEPHDMELLYWRELAHVLAERQDHDAEPYKQVWNTLHSYLTEHKFEATGSTFSEGRHKLVDQVADAKLDPGSEIALWRKAWGNVTSPEQVNEWADKGGYLPHLGHPTIWDQEVTGGKPFWYRFDADPAWLAERQMPASWFQGDSSADAMRVAKSGGYYSTEARLRALGLWVSGMSSSTDMESYGSAGGIFTRLNQEGEGPHVYFNPRILARISDYGFSDDNYGNLANRKDSSYFSIKKAAAWTGSSNETLIKDGVTLLDDIEGIRASSGTQRDAIISFLKSRGVTEIRGLPVEDRVFASGGFNAKGKVKANLKALAATSLDQPAQPYIAPPSEHVEHSIVTTEASEKAQEALDQVKEVSGKQVGPELKGAAPPAAVSQLFFGKSTKPSVSDEMASAEKYKVAARISAMMGNVSDEQLAALISAAGLSAPDHWGKSQRDRDVGALVRVWANGNSSPIALAFQDEAAKLFGLQKPVLPPVAGGDQDTAQELEAQYGNVIDDYLLAQWQASQADLGNAGINSVTLYRVFHFEDGDPPWMANVKAGDVIDVPQQRPIASWGYHPDSAESAGTFSSGGHTVLVKTVVPRQLILSYPKSGMGSYNETEMTVLDSPGKWQVVKV